MSSTPNTTLNNWIGGELSQSMSARFELDVYKKSFAWHQNFLSQPQGPTSYRPGSRNVGLTRNNKIGSFIPFQFNANDAIQIFATDREFRFYRDDAVILNNSVNITAISKANPAVVTANAHGYATGQEVYINNVVGMNQVNAGFYLVTVVDANNFSLQDPFGGNVDSSSFDTYTSGGTVASVFTLTTPYYEADLKYLRYAQVGDVMYLVCKNDATLVAYEPRKLIRTGFTSWTIDVFTRTNEQWAPTVSQAPSAVTQANPAVATVTSTTGMVAGQIIYASNHTGMTQLNGNFYRVRSVIDSTHFDLNDLNGNPVDSTSYGAFTAAGKFETVDTWPGGVAFTGDGRLAYSSSFKIPQGWWASMLPDKSTTKYDDFTTGSTAKEAAVFAFAPVNGQIDTIQEMIQFSSNFALLGASSVMQIYGAQPGQPANPTAVNSKATIQGAAHVRPLVINQDLIFVDVNTRSLRGLQYNLAYDNYTSKDYNLGADHLGDESSFTKLAYVKLPRGEFIWVLRSDGSLLCLTFNNLENIASWSRHYTGMNGKVLDIGCIRRSGGFDELWMLVERTMNGKVYRSIEVMSQWPVIPLRRKFFTGDKASDRKRWAAAAYEALKASAYLDSSLSYDGRVRGSTAGATLTPSAVSGVITLTASANVFQPSDKGSQIWKSYNSSGIGGGIATITSYVSPTQVQAVTEAPFDDVSAMAAGSWAFAVNSVNNLRLYEGITLNVQTDGSGHTGVTVTNGAVSLLWFASVVNVGFGYVGFIATPNIEVPTKSGPSNSKARSITQVRVRMIDSCGGFVGTDEYAMSELVFRTSNQIPNRLVEPFSGVMKVVPKDKRDDSEKIAVFIHRDPTPCCVAALDLKFDINEES